MRSPSDLFAFGLSCLLLVLAGSAASRQTQHKQQHMVERGASSVVGLPAHHPDHKSMMASAEPR